MQQLKRASTLLLGLRRTSCQNITNVGWKFKILEYSSNIETESYRYCTAVVEKSSQFPIDDRFQNPKVALLLEVTVKEGITPDDLLNALKMSPELLEKSSLQWENCFRELKTHGFTKENCLRMLTMYPELFTLVENNELQLCMSQWINCQLGYDNILNLLVACPHFFSISGSELSRRIPLLLSLAKSRGKNVARLLQNCPGLLYQNWKYVEAKLDYVENVMKIDTKKENLSKCYMFNRTLDEIKTRHVFLQRAGIYITPGKIKGTKKEQAQQPWSKNPYLSQITDTNDEVFISEVASGLTLEELEVFKEMYIEELNGQDESDDDFSDSE